MSHAPEPWTYDEKGSLLRDVSGQIVTIGRTPAPTPRTVSSDALPVDMRRIVACVNACRGISTEALRSILQYEGNARLGQWLIVFGEAAAGIKRAQPSASAPAQPTAPS
jgi:hypothetical protein